MHCLIQSKDKTQTTVSYYINSSKFSQYLHC